MTTCITVAISRASTSAIVTAIALACASAMAAGCASRGVHLEDPVGETHTTSSSTGGARPQGVDEPRAAFGVVASDELREACGATHRREIVRFGFEGRRLRPMGDDELGGIVRCLTSGRLSSAALVIVGHTDPRGDDDYSEKLGLHRADAAREALVERGLPHERIAVRSAGARDAKGTNEASWSHDRYVELRLAEPRSQSGVPVPQVDGAGSASASRPTPAPPTAPAPATPVPMPAPPTMPAPAPASPPATTPSPATPSPGTPSPATP